MQAGQLACVVYPAPLPALKVTFGVVDHRPLNTRVVVRVVEDPAPAQTLAVAGGAVDKAQGQRGLLVFSPDAEGQSLDDIRLVADGDIRRQAEVDRFGFRHGTDGNQDKGQTEDKLLHDVILLWQ